ncbi:hypothetical protein C731_3684 [Mycolicibacterium hassiacum DSM 44199]|uniref:Uncharacterized protein n=1 Tax=Mycolicibacterium hassiacum (strain DSM 44199 / CIP 105218 / JCM 12690 / 3849) TaxID=1122247 RepID=K5BDH5_MYCHD|nr:hypothetical protein C731_3684 [Mycolicibacterium hassiacum DSM 44199]
MPPVRPRRSMRCQASSCRSPRWSTRWRRFPSRQSMPIPSGA